LLFHSSGFFFFFTSTNTDTSIGTGTVNGRNTNDHRLGRN
jgi:hypothetical protein